MKSRQRKLVAVAVLASAFATAGCNADLLSSANKTLTQINGATRSLGSARMPTAAIATALGGMEMMKALSVEGQDAKKAGIIAAGGGNLTGGGSAGIIAAGGLNYLLTAFEPGVNKTQKIDAAANKVNGEVRYTSEVKGNSVATTIHTFECVSNGYNVKAIGSFNYTPSAASGGSVNASMSGTVKHGDLEITLEKLEFATEDPLPQNDTDLGKFVMTGTDGGKKITIDATLSLKDGKINAEATVIEDGKPRDKKAVINQDNPNFSGEFSDDAKK